MTYQDVLNAMMEVCPKVIIDGYDINRYARQNYFQILSSIKINNLKIVNEKILKEYALDQENAWSWAYRVMTFLYDIKAIKSVNDLYAEIDFKLD